MTARYVACEKIIRIGSKSMNVARANICRGYSLAEGESLCLLLLMTIFSQTFFALVSGHLMAFSFLSAGHLNYALEINKYVI